MNKTAKHPPTILDIEASGFGAESYPLEIGVKRGDGARFCRLIRPFEDWRHWSQEAERLHGISRETLIRHGVNGVEVCHLLNAFLRGQTAYSDGWVVDYPWLIKLFSAAGVMMEFRLSALEYLLSEMQMANWHHVKKNVLKQNSVARHRASVDAELIQQTYLATITD